MKAIWQVAQLGAVFLGCFLGTFVFETVSSRGAVQAEEPAAKPARIVASELAIVDATGKTRIFLGTKNGAATVTLNDANERPVTYIYVGGDKAEFVLQTAESTDETGYVSFRVSEKIVSFGMDSPANKASATTFLGPEGAFSNLCKYFGDVAAQKQVNAAWAANEQGGTMVLTGKSTGPQMAGAPFVGAGVNEKGDCDIRIYDAKGKPVWVAP